MLAPKTHTLTTNTHSHNKHTQIDTHTHTHTHTQITWTIFNSRPFLFISLLVIVSLDIKRQQKRVSASLCRQIDQLRLGPRPYRHGEISPTPLLAQHSSLTLSCFFCVLTVLPDQREATNHRFSTELKSFFGWKGTYYLLLPFFLRYNFHF